MAIEISKKSDLSRDVSAEPLRGICAERTRKAAMAEAQSADILHGYKEIGAYLRMSRRQAKYLAEAGVLPTFTLSGRAIHARRSTLDTWLAEREARASRVREPEPMPADPEAASISRERSA